MLGTIIGIGGYVVGMIIVPGYVSMDKCVNLHRNVFINTWSVQLSSNLDISEWKWPMQYLFIKKKRF